jgi:D-alanine-D-alanine ligase
MSEALKIIVLAGGLSPERDVSLSSGALIANALLENGHTVMLLDLYLGCGLNDAAPAWQNGAGGRAFHYTVPAGEPDLARLREQSGNGDSQIGPGVLDWCRQADVVFLALHGSIGENGQIQSVFDTFGIRYTGTGYIGSLLAMDKDLSKQLMRAAGIQTADWLCLERGANRDGLPAGSQIPAADIHFPCVIKPCSCGSSVGVAMADSPAELQAALTAAWLYEDRVLVEDRITGREFSVGVLDGVALPVIEIIPKAGFYDYQNKYQAGLTDEICPADLSPAHTQALQDAALAVHRTLRLGFYSRIDFMLDATGTPYCLEANTLPGMTPTSLLPQEAGAAGILYNELCERIARAGRDRIRRF